jgi:hypothetical protein
LRVQISRVPDPRRGDAPKSAASIPLSVLIPHGPKNDETDWCSGGAAPELEGALPRDRD